MGLLCLWLRVWPKQPMYPTGWGVLPHSRKTLIYLILTLNHIYPDYDFSLLRAQNFKKLDGLGRAEETIDSHLLEVSKARAIGCFQSIFFDVCLYCSVISETVQPAAIAPDTPPWQTGQCMIESKPNPALHSQQER